MPAIARSANQAVELEQSKKARLLLTKAFSISLLCVIGVFTAVTLLSFSRLVDFRTTLSDITEKSVPNLVFSGRIFNQVNTLIYLTEGLSKLNSEAGLWQIERDIDTQMNKLQELANAELADPYLNVQLEALKIEFFELKTLIRDKLAVQQLLQVRLDDVYLLYDRILAKQDSSSNSTWSLLIANTVAIAGKVTSMTRIYEVRKTAAQIEQSMALIAAQNDNFSEQQLKLIKQLNASLQYMILGKNGVVELKIEQLRTQGRARGRGNFVRNLILDYANLAEYHSYEVNESVLAQAEDTTNKVNEQIRFIGFISAIALLFLLCVVAFLQTKFIRRLKLLDQLVRHHLEGKKTDIVVTGNDEISDIANTFNSFVTKIEHQNEILQNLSLTDGLTGIPNRRALDERLLHTLNTGLRHSWPTTIMLLDVDYFKKYNDKYGHAKGDDCLIEVAAILSAQMQRENDFVARYGGEEFVCVLGDTGSAGAHKVAEKIIKAMAKYKLPHDQSAVADHVTLSIGVVTYYPINSNRGEPLELLQKADKALYAAKTKGRNTYVMAALN